MEHVVVALTDESTARAAAAWVIERARSKPVQVRLVSELEVNAAGPDAADRLLAQTALRIQEGVLGTLVETVLVDRPLLHELLAQSETADLIVIGSHPDPVIRDGSTASLPVSLAARSRCPAVIVPDDWRPGDGPVVVGVEALDLSREAGKFAAHEAIDSDRELLVVHTWEPWSAQNTRAAQFEHETTLNTIVDRIRADFPNARVRGMLREAVAHDGIIASSRDAYLVVLGTHGLGRETGLVLGAIHQEVMIHGSVALCVVPLAEMPTG
jgi:nucleotide-binding universal stress UspA family protein